MMQNKIIAVTGGIGSGKSTVLKMLKDMGANVVSADDINRQLLMSSEYLKGLEKIFPTAFCDGKFDKSKLKEIVFSDDKARERLNEYAHPCILAELFNYLKTSQSCVFAEVPLLKDALLAKKFDRIIVVVADEKLRLERTAERDNLALNTAKQISNTQATDEERLKIATDVIYNNFDFDALKTQVYSLYKSLSE